MKRTRKLGMVEELATVLGATACSKPFQIWDGDLMASVGQTGKPVATNLYIAIRNLRTYSLWE
jgi:electron transfer flavoprotein alpha subunit